MSEPRREATVPCHICGTPSVCFGAYENPENFGFSCGECCGHGNEDGWCKPIAEITAHFQAQTKYVQDLEALLLKADSLFVNANERADRLQGEVERWKDKALDLEGRIANALL